MKRRGLRLILVAITGLAASLGVVACGGGSTASQISNGPDVPVIPKQAKPDRVFNFSNWPYYVDVGAKGQHPTLDAFKRKYGTAVHYFEDIQSNQGYFDSIRQHLASHESAGRDLFVLTDWMASRMIQLGYVQRLDHSVLPNVSANLVDSLRSPSFDPKRDFTVPWQSGMTGLAVRTDLAPNVKSIADIFDPKYRGKVTMVNEMRDSAGLVMLSNGDDPSHFNGTAPVRKALDKIQAAVADGQIRHFTGDSYKDLIAGKAWISFAYSGDVVQLQAKHPKIKFVLPQEGAILWSDNMMIPAGALHPYTAELFMNFVYDPKVQAGIADYVNYIPPVKGVKNVLAQQDPRLASNPLVFPTDQALKMAHIFKVLTPDEDQTLRARFQRITQSRPGLTQG